MRPLRVILTALPFAAIAAAAAFFWTEQPRNFAEAARYEADSRAIQENAEAQHITVDQLRKHAAACPLSSVETEWFGLKRTEPDYGSQKECQARQLYGDFYETAYNAALARRWLTLAAWIVAACVTSAAMVLAVVLTTRFVRQVWWPWINTPD